MGLIANSGNLPTIRNVGLISRAEHLKVAIPVTIDGSTISADGYMVRGTILVYNTANNKWHAFVHGTDTFVSDQVSILVDDLKVTASTDAPCSAYREGYFNLADVLDANSAAPQSLVLADLTGASVAGFHFVPALPGGSYTEFKLK